MKSSSAPAPADKIASECIAVQVRLLNRVITSLYDEALRPLGLRVSQMNILVVASKLGIAQPAVVCKLLQMDASTLSRNVDRMVTRGWLERVPTDDAREQPFRITPKGITLLEGALSAWEQGQRGARKILGKQGVSVLSEVTGKFRRLPP
ncbi:MAG: MarR family winged helix-turn-helix transcriptional regulator [Gammaproteobacteria bacterium]